MKHIAIGGDHAGFLYKKKLVKYLTKLGYQVTDYGTDSEQSVDYPDYIHPLAKGVEARNQDLGIIICGSGNGVAMTANKYSNIRAAICWKREIAQLARQHNNANIISIPARYVSYEMAKNMVSDFLNTEFEGGRHERRVNKISC